MAKKTASVTATAAALTKTNEELARKYFDTLRKAQLKAQKQLEDAARKLLLLPNTIQEKARQEAADLLTKYVEALRSASGQPNAAVRVEEALRDYVFGLQNLQVEAQRVVEETAREYQNALREIPQAARDSLQQAYVTYLSEIKDVLADVDFESTEAEAVASVGRSMLAVALSTKAGMIA